MKNLIMAAAVVALVGQSVPASLAGEEKSGRAGKAQASSTIKINASPRLVWKAIHKERQEDPEIAYSKVLETTGNTVVIDQKYLNIPVLGAVQATTRQVEEFERSIDYSLISSDKFKSMSGRWVLTPVENGRSTSLALSTNLDVGLPFASFLVKNAAQKRLEKRLGKIKDMAESEQVRIGAAL